mgnify:CR=1 FL=1
MRTLNDYFLTVKLADISSASSAFVAIPDAGEVVKILAVQEGAVSGTNFFYKRWWINSYDRIRNYSSLCWRCCW